MALSQFGRYKIIDEIGQGGMAKVYEARDPVIERPVALKIILEQYSENPRFNQRFRREANIIANLEHRAILPVYDFGEDETTGKLFLVMRLMPDVLHERIARDGALSLEETSLILNRLAAALTMAHNRDIVHRDIKPANILLDSDGTIFLSDFGLAAFANKLETSSVPSAYGGSPFYMAPEQWQDGPVGPHTDVYQLGVTLFEMLTGKRPYPETDMNLLLDRHLNGLVPKARDLNPKLPRNIEPILEKAMAKNRLDRYATPEELAEAVAKLLRPEKIKNRYEIKEELQHGRMAVVYLAHDLYEDRDVALKILKHKLIRNQAFQQRFQQQKQIVKSIQHTAVVPVYDVEQHNGKPFLAMQFMNGSSLRERFRKERHFSVETVCQLAERLAGGLDAIHAGSKTHGDINLGNVLLDVAGNCYLTDFHITSLVELTDAVMSHKDHLGYLPYLPPEQWRGELPTLHSDVYQFGVMLFELLTGQLPFPQEPTEKLRHAIENDTPPRATTINSDLPPQFNKILAKAMAKQPQDRFASASELVARLNQARETHVFETLRQQGENFYKEKHWDDAIGAYNQALEIRPYASVVRSALDRAEKRKLESGIFHRSQIAIEENRWDDAAHFLQQIPATPETDDSLEYVQQKILIERQYDEGKAAMQRQEWVVAHNLFDEADRLQPNHKDVNRLLGQLDEKIAEVLAQAQEARSQERWDEALGLLDSVEGHETAVLLRQEIAVARRQSRLGAWWRALSRNEQITIIATVVTVVGIVITLLTFFPDIFSGGTKIGETISSTIPANVGIDAETAVPTETPAPAVTPTPSIIAMENCLAETAVEIEVLGKRYDGTKPITLPRQSNELTIKLLPNTCSITEDHLLYRLISAADSDPEYQASPNLEYTPPIEGETEIILVNLMIDEGSYTYSVALNIIISE
ncbi:MAG: serine/threonine protein kinase [Chloroflexi bacterium]|nr:serine/threonine protein kinase [Chloroflexota bacterium]